MDIGREDHPDSVNASDAAESDFCTGNLILRGKGMCYIERYTA